MALSTTVAQTWSIPGLPEPAGSPKIIRIGNRPAIIWQKGPKWQKVIQQTIRGKAVVLAGPVGVKLLFRLPKPKKPKFPVPATPPDLDKLVRAVLDALTGYAYDDDARVLELTANKDYATEDEWTGVIVTVYPV